MIDQAAAADPVLVGGSGSSSSSESNENKPLVSSDPARLFNIVKHRRHYVYRY